MQRKGNMKTATKKSKTKNPVKVSGVHIREVRPGYYLADFIRNNKRVRKCFDNMADAKFWAESIALTVLNEGTDSLQLPEKVKRAIPGLLNKLNGRATLEQVVEYWLERNPDGTHETWDKTFLRYVEYMEKHNCRHASIIDKRVKCNVLSGLLGNPFTASVDEQLLKRTTEATAKKLKWSLSTEKSYLSAGLTLWRFYHDKNRRHGDKDQAAPLTWDAAFIATMMETAKTECPAIIPALAVMTFAGIRPNEAIRLSWDNIRFDDGIIALGGEITKTRNARNVNISENLKEWLLAYKGKGKGLLISSHITFKRGRDKLREKLGLTEWPADVLRHTAATMLYAKTNDLNLTAAQLGHFNTKTFLTFYKGNPPSAESIKEFWAITPNKKEVTK
jgi:integrase